MATRAQIIRLGQRIEALAAQVDAPWSPPKFGSLMATRRIRLVIRIAPSRCRNWKPVRRVKAGFRHGLRSSLFVHRAVKPGRRKQRSRGVVA